MILFLFLSNFALGNILFGSYDTQFQTTHQNLRDKMWVNPHETLDGIDNDSNGFVDDIHGWNFGDNNSVMFEPESDVYDRNVILYSELKMKKRAELITKEEQEWLDANASKYDLLWRYYIGFIHGTGSATTILKDTQDIRIIGLRAFSKSDLIPSVPTEKPKTQIKGIATEEEIQKFKMDYANEIYIPFEKAVTYGANQKVRGFQFGLLWTLDGNDAADLKGLIAERLGLEISDERAEKLAREFYETLMFLGKDLFSSNPSILFFMPAGNSSFDNDSTISFPNSLPGENAIVAGASYFFKDRAVFSSYGKETVDILIPTINITEDVPNNLKMVSSATSVSVVLMANLGARILELNPALSSLEVKKIIFETAVYLEHLKDDVKTSSIAHTERAIEAARLSRFMNLESAIQSSFKIIPD